MEKDVLLGHEISIVTISEYKELMKKFFTAKGNEQTVVWCFTSSGYQFWTKHRSFDDIGRIYWKHEPLMKRYFSSEDECLANLTRTGGITGSTFRWLPGNMASHDAVVLQPAIIREDDTEQSIDSLVETMTRDRMFGMLMDPFVYVGEFDEKGEFTDAVSLDNYRVFIIEISLADYEKMEDEYVKSIETGRYDDGLIHAVTYKNFEMSDDFKSFLKKHTHFDLDD